MSRAEWGKARRVMLDLGAVGDVAEIIVNGRALPALLKAPFSADITGLIRPGTNELEIRITNSLSNMAMKREPAFPADPAMYLANVLTPRPGGLIGPVRVMIDN